MSSNWLGGNNKWKIAIQASEMALTVLHLEGIFGGQTQNQPLMLNDSFSRFTDRHRGNFPVPVWSKSYSLIWACITGNEEEQHYCWDSLLPVEVNLASVRAFGIFSSNNNLLWRTNTGTEKNSAKHLKTWSLWSWSKSEFGLRAHVTWDTKAIFEGSSPFYCCSRTSLGFWCQGQPSLCITSGRARPHPRFYVVTVGIYRLPLR